MKLEIRRVGRLHVVNTPSCDKGVVISNQDGVFVAATRDENGSCFTGPTMVDVALTVFAHLTTAPVAP